MKRPRVSRNFVGPVVAVSRVMDRLVATSRAQFRFQPGARFVREDQWLYFALSPEVRGYALFGRVTRDGVHDLVSFMESELASASHAVVAHLGQVEAAEPGCFEVLANFVRTNRKELKRVVTSAVIVRPDGYTGAIVSGFFGVVTPPFPTRVFASLSEALSAVHVASDALNTVLDQARRSNTVRALANYLDAAEHPSLDDAAAALGLSRRTLQRRLHAADTAFGSLVVQHRIERGTHLLTQTEWSVTRIAIELGYTSSQQFSRAFRSIHHVSPTTYRSARR